MPQDNASVIVKRDTKSVIDQTPKINGQMLWTTDIGQDNYIYTDVVDPSNNTVKRIQIGGISPETKQAIQQAVTDASASASSASTSATSASNSATEAQSYAKGGTNSRQGEDTDNAKYYKEQADASATNASTSATNASTSATTASNKATEASTSATNASNSATQASDKATLSESYAKGGTGTRTGEDTDNAEYYKEQAKAYAESASQGVQPATPSTIGGVKPDNVTITVDGVGAITAQEVQEITQANFDALTTKNPKIAYFVKSSTSGTTGRIWYNDSWFGGSDITIDTVLDTTSNNPIANSAVATALEGKQNTLTTAQLEATNSGITAAKVSKLDALPTSTQLDTSLTAKANKSDITNISITGTTNNTGSNISAGTLFYLNGSLCKALVDVASGATFTDGTNYSTWTMNGAQVKTTVELMPNVLYIDKVGKLCILHTRGTIVIPSGSHSAYETVIEVNIPTGFRPISTTRSFAVSINKNIYGIELQNSSNKLFINVWSPNSIIVNGEEYVHFVIPYFTND